MPAIYDALLSKELHDISVPIESSPLYPGDSPPLRQWRAGLEGGSGCRLSHLSLGSHAGTHIDSPSHTLRDGPPLDSYPSGRFITPALVIAAQDCHAIPAEALQNASILKGEAILFKTSNSSRGLMHEPVFRDEYVYLSMPAAKMCITLGAGLVGIDYLSVDRYEDDSLPVHNILLKNDILILEGIDLDAVLPGRYWLICLPLKMKDAEASPVRAVLLGRSA
ncbi:MAG: cyclase family protein [Methanothrix sp.]|uniref:cyclase family protein n=1 Tax=Methanothrix sp. TaxID=90426 RepID=UPI003BB64EEC